MASNPVSRRFRLIVTMCVLGIVVGCGGEKTNLPENRNPVYPVKGAVHIDGVAVAAITVFAFRAEDPKAIPDAPVEPTEPGKITAQTGSGGKFEFTTYTAGDGLPAGDYVLAFYWDGGGAEVLGTDERTVTPAGLAFNKKYRNPAKSEIKFSVGEGKPPVDLGVLDLKTKK